MNLVRLGHYFTPVSGKEEELDGSCRTALVVYVWNDEVVNLAVWNENGGQEVRTSVLVEAPSNGNNSFHLAMDCPWKR